MCAWRPKLNAEGAVPSEPAGHRSQSMTPAVVLAVVLIVGVGLLLGISTSETDRSRPATARNRRHCLPDSSFSSALLMKWWWRLHRRATGFCPVASESEPPGGIGISPLAESPAEYSGRGGQRSRGERRNWTAFQF